MSSIRGRQDIRPLSEFRANAAAFVQHVRQTRRPLVLTRRGRGAAVLLDIAEYERFVERAELLEDIATAEEQVAAGEGIEHEEAKEQILARPRR
jgi:antitoxin YefM